MTTFDYARARDTMVEQQVRPWDVLDARVLQAIATLPREQFVAVEHRALAYADLPLPIGHGEFMCKPVIEGRILQALRVQPGEDVLEIGTGSGYLTAALATMGRDVVSIEQHADLADTARRRLSEARIGNAQVHHADAFAWQNDRQFDVVCVTGATALVPHAFLNWLKPGGRMFVVHGHSPAMQAALVRHGSDVNAPLVESLFETDLAYLTGAAPVPTFEF